MRRIPAVLLLSLVWVAGCPAHQFCVQGSCQDRCPLPQINCNGVCANLMTDSQHCNDCNSVCGTGTRCVSGSCQLDCGSLTSCNGTCINPLNDPANCGGC